MPPRRALVTIAPDGAAPRTGQGTCRPSLCILLAMRQVEKYLIRQILLAFSVAAVALTAAVWLSQSLRLVDMIVNRGLPFSEFVYLAILMLPTFLVVILPIALFASVLFTYTRLTSDSELVVLRAAGLGPLDLARPALIVALSVMAFGYLLTLYLVPVSFREFKDLQFVLRNDYSTVMLREGTFNTLTDDLTVYVRERRSDGELLGILVHDARVPQRPVTLIAERGALVKTDTGPRVVMVNGNRQQVDRGQLSILYFDRYAIDVGNLGGPMGARWREPRERFVHELLTPALSEHDRVYRTELVAEGHQRLTSPFYAVVLTLAALCCVLLGTFERRGQGRRVLIAIVAAVLIQGGGLALGNLMPRAPAATPLLYVFPLAVALAALLLLRGWPRPLRAPGPAPRSAIAG